MKTSVIEFKIREIVKGIQADLIYQQQQEDKRDFTDVRVDSLLELFAEARLDAKREVIEEFMLFIKHWIRGHKQKEWNPILMDTLESFLEIRGEEFLTWEFEEKIKNISLLQKDEGSSEKRK